MSEIDAIAMLLGYVVIYAVLIAGAVIATFGAYRQLTHRKHTAGFDD